MKTFLEFLVNESENEVDEEDHATDAGTVDVVTFAKGHKANIKKNAKIAKKKSTPWYQGDKDVPKNTFGDEKIVNLSRKPDIDRDVPADLIGQEMKATQPTVKANRDNAIRLYKKKADEINRGVNSGD